MFDGAAPPGLDPGAPEAEQPGLRSAMLATSFSILAAQQRAERELLEMRDTLQRQNQALEEANSILEATLNATPVGVLVADPAGGVPLHNRRFDDLWKAEERLPTPRQLDEVVGSISAQLLHPDLFEAWSAQVQRHPDGEYGLQCQTRDGRHLHCQALPRRQGGRVVGVVYNWLDVTERVQAETLRSQVRAADLAAREKSSFISRASHELRTPLNAVLGFAQLLQRHATVLADEKLGSQVGHIRAAGEHLRALMEDLMQLSRLETGSLPLLIEAVDLAAVLREAVALVEPQAAACDVTIDALSTAVAWVRGDRTRLRQVLLNLLSNAVKYNRRGGRVGLSLSRGDDEWQLEIADQGQGLSEQQLTHLFEPFNRLGAERGGTEGTGLGLAITRQLVLAMHGHIEARSTLGQGAVFVLDLPALPAPQSA